MFHFDNSQKELSEHDLRNDVSFQNEVNVMFAKSENMPK